MRQRRAFGVFLAEALALPTGIITVVFLLRTLGAEAYGLYVVAFLVVSWAQVILAALIGQPAQAFVVRAPDWRKAGADVTLLHVLVSAGVAAAVALASKPLAGLLGHPELASLMALAAIDIALFGAAHGCRTTAMATDRFGLRAAMAAVRWIVRLILIFAFVLMGWGAAGAILASVFASACELALGLIGLRMAVPDLKRLKGFWGAAAPVSAAVVGFRIFEKVDLLFVQSLVGAAAAGLYGAAQNFTIVATLFGMSYSGAVLTGVARHRDEPEEMAATAAQALRLGLRIAPFAALGAAIAPQIATIAFGERYAGAAPLIATLAGAALFMILTGLATAVLTGAGRGTLVFITAAPALPLAILGHWIMVPLYGAEGAAICTLAISAASAVAGWTAVFIALRCPVPWLPLGRIALICAGIGAAALFVPLPPLAVAALLTLATPLAMLLTGEVPPAELRGMLKFGV